MNTKHTPGPWANRFGLISGNHDRVPVAAMQDEKGNDYPNAVANAQLIIGAPDLLQAAIDTLQAAEEMGITCPNAEGLRAAIAKATGEQ